MVTTLFGNNLRRVIFLLVVGVFVSMGGAFAAPPVNDECDNALFVTPGVAISGQAFNIEATFAPDDPGLSCVLGPGFGSVFFEFVATNTSARIRTDLDSVGLDSDFAVYAVDQINWCDKSLWTEVGCSEDGEFEFNGDICIEGLTIGDTYKIMLVSFTEGSSGNYTLQIDSPCSGQASGGGGDADGDGVPDAVDQCPATPTGETVDANGCSETQLDDDGDGVNNAIDQCPNTPAGVFVDAVGCFASQLDAQTKVQEIIVAINVLDPGVFKKPKDQKKLEKDLNKVIKEIAKGKDKNALKKLNKVLEKMDGCALRGAPDLKVKGKGKGKKKNKEDSIQDCNAQAQVYPMLLDAIALLQ